LREHQQDQETNMSTTANAKRRNLWLASFGAMLEYYDFVVYIYVASKISGAFFPAGTSESVKLMQTLGIYSLGFLIRPLAGITIAHYADRIGRKGLFIMTVALMSISTFGMGLLPGYAQIGWLAPVLLLLLRLLQGCAVGGELPSAGVFVAEHAGAGRAGYAGGVLQAMAYGGFLLGAGAAVASDLISTAVGTESLSWRLPFIVGGVFGLIAGYLRRRLDETPLFLEAKQVKHKDRGLPLGIVLKSYRGACLFGLGAVFVMTVINIVFFQYWPTLVEKQLGFSHAFALTASLTAIAAVMISLPFWGMLCDRFGWQAALGGGAALLAALSLWFFGSLARTGSEPLQMIWMVIPVAIACGAVVAPVPGILSTIFPTEVRQSGYAVAYNIGVALFGGPLPVLLVWLTGQFGLAAIAYLVTGACGVSMLLAMTVSRVTQHLAMQERPMPIVAASPAPGR
jgi:MFS family permease